MQRLLDAHLVLHMVDPSTADYDQTNNSKAVSTIVEHCALDIQDTCFGNLNQAFEI